MDDASSVRVALQLREQGFPQAHALAGGFEAWRSLGYPTEPKGPKITFF